MVHPNQLVDVSLKAAQRTVRRTQETLRDIPNAHLVRSAQAVRTAPLVRQVVSTAHVIITAEERLRQRVRSALRVVVATLFLGISGLISLGANVSMAFAKKVSPETRSSQTQKVRRSKSHHKTVYLRNGAARRPDSAQLRGEASWYGKQFNHRKTASGVRFDTHAMMAAHRTLPFGTRVRVTNLVNKQSCVVEITDRGPFAKGRIIDLSYAAASQIGIAKTGVGRVKLDILSPNDELPDIADEQPDSLAVPMPIHDATSVGANDSVLAATLVANAADADVR